LIVNRQQKEGATPLADRLRAFVAARTVDERMSSTMRSIVIDLADRAEIVDLAEPELQVAKEMLAIGIGWLENAYDTRGAGMPLDMAIATCLLTIRGPVEMLPGLREANLLGCQIEIDEFDCKLWMCRHASKDRKRPNWEELRPKHDEDFLDAVRRSAKRLRELDAS
jgi:hypothetical protein